MAGGHPFELRPFRMHHRLPVISLPQMTNRQVIEGIHDPLQIVCQVSPSKGPLIPRDCLRNLPVVEGDTGLSVSIQAALDAVVGQSKSIPLFSKVETVGNNAVFTLVEFVGIRIMKSALQVKDKELMVQMAPFHDGTAVPDYDTVIGKDTTVFTPLILID